ncbi:MAG TPA: sigma-E factor negative regulatory protein [Xanthomonadales bacterium]|nr:sigma-E factor negative regulatory protein [Xanthomonadales bacterium]
MNMESREHLSSFMDGEVSQETARFLVRRLGADGDLRQAWASYHLIRDCLRHEDGHITQLDLSGRVRAALSSEPAVTAVAQAGKGWFKPVLGAALAASVAVMAVLTVSKDNSPGAGLAAVERTETELTQPFASPNIGRMTPVSQPVNLSGSSPQAKAKMNTYLLRHYQLTGESGGKGFVSFVPIVVTQEPAKGGTELENGEKDGEPSQK